MQGKHSWKLTKSWEQFAALDKSLGETAKAMGVKLPKMKKQKKPAEARKLLSAFLVAAVAGLAMTNELNVFLQRAENTATVAANTSAPTATVAAAAELPSSSAGAAASDAAGAGNASSSTGAFPYNP